jgi:hypothetical protein
MSGISTMRLPLSSFTESKELRSIIPLVLVAFFNLVPVRANAQVSGEALSGTMTNEAGAVIPDVQVSLNKMATGFTRVVTTDVAGLYTAPDVPLGPYKRTVSGPGFTPQVWTGITITVGAKLVVNIAMKVGNPRLCRAGRIYKHTEVCEPVVRKLYGTAAFRAILASVARRGINNLHVDNT